MYGILLSLLDTSERVPLGEPGRSLDLEFNRLVSVVYDGARALGWIKTDEGSLDFEDACG